MSLIIGKILYEWTLQKYARYIENVEKVQQKENEGVNVGDCAKAAEKGSWQHFTSTESEPIRLVLTDSSHMLVLKDKVILENHQLVANAGQMRAAGRGFSIMVMVKIQGEERRFRVRFPDAHEDRVGHCAQILSKFITIDYSTSNPDGGGDRVVPISRLTSMLLKGRSADGIQRAYTSLPSLPRPEELDALLRLCLSDSTFPEFVQTVEDRLRDLMKPGAENAAS